MCGYNCELNVNTSILFYCLHLTALIGNALNKPFIVTCSVQIILGKETPTGCTMQTVGDKCEVHVMLRGHVDTAREIDRLQEKISKLSLQLDKLQTTMATEGYEQKV